MRARSVTQIRRELTYALTSADQAIQNNTTTRETLASHNDFLGRLKSELNEAYEREKATIDNNPAVFAELTQLQERYLAITKKLIVAMRAKGEEEFQNPLFLGPDDNEKKTTLRSSDKRANNTGDIPQMGSVDGLLAPRTRKSLGDSDDSYDESDDQDALLRGSRKRGLQSDDDLAGPGMDLPSEEDDTLDEDEEEENEEYFFAATIEEFTAKARELKARNHKELEEHLNLAEKTLLACEKMEDSASTLQQRKNLSESIDHQLEQLRKIQGFLSDCLLLNEDNGTGHDRNDATRKRDAELLHQYAGTQKITPDKIELAQKRFANNITALQTAKRFLSNMPESGPTKSVYYANLNEAVPCASFQVAKDHATAFLGNRAQIDPNAIVAEAGISEKGSTDIYNYRFIATEVDTTNGKQAVAVIQHVNASKTYSKQTVLTPAGTIDNLKKASHDDQMKFVAHLIETQLASITTNGPIRISRNWDPKLAIAAATYAKAMGYDFQPKEMLAKVKATEVANYLMKNKDEPFMLEAIARRDAKLNTVSSPRFRR